MVPFANAYYKWNGPEVAILGSETNAEGDVLFGKMSYHCDWNQLHLSSNAFGTVSVFDSPADLQRVVYNTGVTVYAQADPGAFLDYYVITKTDTFGGVAVTTNDVIGTTTSSSNVPIDNIVGYNAIFVAFDTTTTLTSSTSTSSTTTL